MIYIFGDYELDTSRYELRRQGQPLRVAPKVFDLLVYLIQHHGQYVSKETLYEHLWPNQYVSESALAYCVTEARRAIGDTGRAQRIIKTVYGRGYRFIAPVQEYSPGSTDEARPVALTPPVEEPMAYTSSVLSIQARQAFGREPDEARSQQPLALASSPAEAERRQLTVMQCRLFMPPGLSEVLDPEDLHEAIQRAHNVGGEIVHRFEGSIAQHVNDGFMAYFGYPHAHEDDARQAVRTGLQLVREMARLNEGLERERDVRLTVCVGIHTGMVVMDAVRSSARQEPLALGGYPFNAGHCVTSITYREGLMALPRPGQVIDVR